MVSDFIEERNGYLALTQEEFDRAKSTNPNARMYARQLFEYGESREGYWTSEHFVKQIERAAKIVEIKYPKSDGWRVAWVFDHSSCHAAMPDDALDVGKMNVKPGGKQRVMTDGWWGGKVQKTRGVPKGMKLVLEERGVDTYKMNADKMREVFG